MTTYSYDVLVIGLGPAGMAVSIMASAMGLRVCAIEKHRIGGECMNVGCIPSKSLLRMGKTRSMFKHLSEMELEPTPAPGVRNPFGRIQEYVDFIGDHKTRKMFEKVDLVLGRGDARFINTHTVEAGGTPYTAKRIYICTGTRPAIPPIPGIDQCDPLTNENLFRLPAIPKSMLIIGGGAIGCEMAQAFNNLGCPCSIVQMDAHLLPAGDPESGHLLEDVFTKEGIRVFNGRSITRLERREGGVFLYTAEGEELTAERLLVAAGRRFDFSRLNLEAAGVQSTKRGITVNPYLQTTQSSIYAPGDCNGHYLLTHAAMHQGMLALMNSMLPRPFKRRFENYVVPWTVFTSPPVSHAGRTRIQLEQAGIRFEAISEHYGDYGAAIAENIPTGFVSAYVSPAGKILGTRIVGEGAGEMIGEWALAIQKKLKIYDIMMLQHSFPTMSFLSKRVAENWMMKRMKSEPLKNMCRFFFRFGQ